MKFAKALNEHKAATKPFMDALLGSASDFNLAGVRESDEVEELNSWIGTAAKGGWVGEGEDELKVELKDEVKDEDKDAPYTGADMMRLFREQGAR